MASIREHHRGFQVLYRDPSGRQRAKSFSRKTDARAFAAAVETDKRRGLWVDPRRGSIRFSSLAETWLASRVNVRASSRARDDAYLRLHVLPAFGDRPVGRILRSDVQSWVAELGDKHHLAPATVRQCYWILRSILGEAVDGKLIPESPCRRIALPRVPHREHLHLTPEEVVRLGTAIGNGRDALVYSAVYLGCRWGELVGLKRENLDLLRRQVRIVGTLEEVSGKPRYVEETKSRASRRTLSVPPFLLEMLSQHLAAAPPSEFVFSGRAGLPLRRSNFRRRHWKPALLEAGLDPALRFHDLRHTCAALLIAQGAHPKEIQARLGHASITTTLNTYGHLWPSLGVQLDEKIEQVFRASVDQVLTKVVPIRAREGEKAL